MNLKLALFDMDGTAVRYTNSSFHSSWDAIGIAAGVAEEWDRLLKYYIDKPEIYQEWFDKNCACLAGKDVAPIFDEVFPPPYTPGFKEVCDYLREKEIPVGIVSAGVDFVANRIKREMNVNFVIANEVFIEGGKFTGKGRINVSISGKGDLVRNIMAEYGVLSKETAFVGDNFNDAPVWKEVGLPLAVNLDSKEHADLVKANFKDFYELVDYLETYLR